MVIIVTMNILFPKEVDVSKIEYSEMKSFGDHAKIIYVKYNNNPIYIQTPIMKCPYGLSTFDDGEKPKYSLDLSFGNIDNKSSVKDLKSFLENIDDKILDDSVKNSLQWFKKKNQSKDVSQALYSSSIRFSTENGEQTDKYPPTFKMKLQKNINNKFKVECYNTSKERIEEPLEQILTKGQSVRAISKLSGIWFAGGKFGCSWELVQLKFNPTSNISQYAFNDDSDDNDSDDDNSKNGSENENKKYVIDSDEDSDL